MRFTIRLLGAVVLALFSTIAAAQTFPQSGKQIRIIVGFAAGGGSDVQVRLVAPKLQEALGVPVVVENRPGASTMLAAQAVARAPADGYTLLYTYDGTLTQNPRTLANVQYDANRDFTPISLAARGGLVLTTHPSVPAGNLQEFIAYAKANPGKLSYASFGVGSMAHIFGEALNRTAGLDLQHVPYRGTGDALNDLLSGRVHIMFDAAPTAIQYSKAGKVKLLAAATDKRYRALPELPTLTEQGVPGIDVPGVMGFYGPAGMPPDVLQKLNAAINKALSSPEVVEGFAIGGFEAGGSTPAEHAATIKRLSARWGDYIKQLGLPKQ